MNALCDITFEDKIFNLDLDLCCISFHSLEWPWILFIDQTIKVMDTCSFHEELILNVLLQSFIFFFFIRRNWIKLSLPCKEKQKPQFSYSITLLSCIFLFKNFAQSSFDLSFGYIFLFYFFVVNGKGIQYQWNIVKNQNRKSIILARISVQKKGFRNGKRG